MTKNFAGIYPPIAIPFNKDESIAFDKLEKNLSKWIEQPLAGIVVPGSNSEAVHLTYEERIEIWDFCQTRLKETDKLFIAGIGGDSTREAIRLAHAAAQAGADAALILPPYFYKPAICDQFLVRHFYAVADESPIPLLLYNVPVFTGVDFSAESLIKLAEHKNIIGYKDSSVSVVKTATVLSAKPDFMVFCGTGSALLPFLSLGATGGIMALANFAGEDLYKVYRAFLSNNLDSAREKQLRLVDINTAVTSGFGVPGLKYAMDQCGFDGGYPRKPLIPLDEDSRNKIDQILREIKMMN